MALREYSNQGEMFGPGPELLLPAGHWARVLGDIVEKLGLQRLNRKYEHTPGEPAYDVRVLVKVLIYAYGRGITSSREMARQCEESIAFRYLTRGQCPDFRTISLFRRKKRHLLECPVRALCATNARGFRSIQVRPDHAEVRKIRERFKSEPVRAVYRKRKGIIEPIFGRWQHNWGIRRLRLRGLAGFSAELHLLAIAHNVTKLFKSRQGLAGAVVMP